MNEPRYIDANLIPYQLDVDEESPMEGALIVTKGQVDRVSTADVAPVVHGHWIYFYNGCYYIGVCSICGKQTAFAETNDGVPHGYPHCPHCGAKMDEREENVNGRT